MTDQLNWGGKYFNIPPEHTTFQSLRSASRFGKANTGISIRVEYRREIPALRFAAAGKQ